jgi:hypothetical protein
VFTVNRFPRAEGPQPALRGELGNVVVVVAALGAARSPPRRAREPAAHPVLERGASRKPVTRSASSRRPRRTSSRHDGDRRRGFAPPMQGQRLLQVDVDQLVPFSAGVAVLAPAPSSPGGCLRGPVVPARNPPPRAGAPSASTSFPWPVAQLTSTRPTPTAMTDRPGRPSGRPPTSTSALGRPPAASPTLGPSPAR